jgi:predicted MFS family arabinose efflux permease
MVWQGAQVIGFAAGGLLLAAVGPRGSLALDSASFLGSALVVRLGTHPRTATASSEVGLMRDSLGSLRLVLANRTLRRLLLLRWLVPSCALVPEALIAPYVHVLHAPSRDVGILLSSIAAGMLVANLAVGRLASTRQQRRLLVPMALLNVVPLIAFLAPIGLWVSIVLLAASGIGSCYSLGRDSRFIAAVPADIRARALAIDSSGLMVVQGIGFVVWGALAEVLSVRTTIAVAGALGVVVIATLAQIRDA